MARYIDADLFIENIAKIEDLRTLSTRTIGEAISKTPTADVVEVKHGEWDNNGEFYQCSKCDNYTNYNYEYCPYCGAKMDGGKAE